MSLDLPKRLLVLEEIKRRLEAIHGAAFHTNAGNALFLGESPELGENDSEQAIAIVPLEDSIVHQKMKLQCLWPIEVHALSKGEGYKAWRAVELVVADIKTALELTDREFGGLIAFPGLERLSGTRTRHRETGSRTVGVVVPYLARIQEAYGNPT